MGERAKILVVDDNEDTRYLLDRMLRDAGYEVKTAIDGETALELVEKESFDLIIADVMLPGKSGVQITWEMREKGIQTPVVAMTAYLEKWDRDDLYDCGITTTVEKPIEKNLLLDVIEKILSGEYLREGDVY